VFNTMTDKPESRGDIRETMKVQAASDRHDSCHMPQYKVATFGPTFLYLSHTRTAYWV